MALYLSLVLQLTLERKDCLRLKNLGQSKTLAEIPGTCIHFVDAAEIVEKGALRVRMICEQTLVLKNITKYLCPH